jgi:hypothetical protein
MSYSIAEYDIRHIYPLRSRRDGSDK